MAFAQGLPLRAKEPFSFEHLHREEKGMNHVVKTVVFMGKTVLFIVALLCAVWWMITIYLLMAYGPLESLTFGVGSILLSILVCKRNHSRHKYDRNKCDCDRR